MATTGEIRPVVIWGLLIAWLAWGACAVAEVLLLHEVESVMVTGPVIFILGLFVITLALIGRYRLLAMIGLADTLICVLFFTLVQVLTWGPGDAYAPFAVLGAIYVASLLPIMLTATRRVPRTRQGDRCLSCGYLLHGLPEPRCPECGQPFDPRAVSPPPNSGRKSL